MTFNNIQLYIYTNVSNSHFISLIRYILICIYHIYIYTTRYTTPMYNHMELDGHYIKHVKLSIRYISERHTQFNVDNGKRIRTGLTFVVCWWKWRNRCVCGAIAWILPSWLHTICGSHSLIRLHSRPVFISWMIPRSVKILNYHIVFFDNNFWNHMSPFAF